MHEYPKISWPTAGWGFTVIGAVIGLVLLLLPGITNLPLASRLAITAALSSLPALLVGLWYALRVTLVFLRRGYDYGTLTSENTALRDSLTNFIDALRQERGSRNIYRIRYCYAYDDRTFIALRKKPGRALTVGTRMVVVDTADNTVMGYFVVRRVDEHYVCERDGPMDGLWLGNVKQHGTGHSEAPPEAFAVAISDTTGDGDE